MQIGIQYDKVLLAVTDAAAYMLLAIRSLQVLYPKMLHVTCCAHGLHRVAEFIRSQFPNVNDLISNTKAVFVKVMHCYRFVFGMNSEQKFNQAPGRRKIFQEICPDIGLPPSPVTTRWGTWLKAAIYYCDNFDAVKTAMAVFNDDDAEAIRNSKQMFAISRIKTDLAYIKTNFSAIIPAIVKLETQGLPLNESVEIVESIRESLNSLRRKEFVRKMDDVLRRNVGFKSLVIIRDILYGGSEVTDEYSQKLTPNELAMFKFCPMSSADVERSFSIYGDFLSKKRKSFLFVNLKHHMVVNCNKNKNE